jgi:arginine deiminase
MSSHTTDAAHGGPGWLPRSSSLRQEINGIWGDCGVSSEWSGLKEVLLHRPGNEIKSITDANKALMHSVPDSAIAQHQHDCLADAYQKSNVHISYVEPYKTPPPNLMFVADLLFMTPEGAILARPASRIRAGEERFVAQKLSSLGIPILRCVRGSGVFEGADALWIDPGTVMIGIGLRTNVEGANQVSSLLREMEVDVVRVALPPKTMHLMGALRFVDQDHAICWENRIPEKATRELKQRGFTVSLIPNKEEAAAGMALNFVTLGPNRILMPLHNPETQSFYEEKGIVCTTIAVKELHKASGGIACLTGILKRE